MRAVQRFGTGVIGVGERWVENEMKELMGGDVCRRVVIDREMDGRGDRFGCEVGEERCDVCQGRARGRKRRRMVVWNDEEDIRPTQLMRVQERERLRERSLYDLSSDGVVEESDVEESDVEESDVEESDVEESDVEENDVEENDVEENDVEEIGARVRVGMDERVRVGYRRGGGRIELPTLNSGLELEEGREVDGIEESDGMEFGTQELEMASQDSEGERMVEDQEMEMSDEIWRQDGGGWKNAENAELLTEWRRQQEGYEREERRRIAEKVGGREIVEDLEEKMREWRVKCMICKAIGGERGRRCQRQDWQSCELVTEVERKAMESGIEASKKILMEKFAGCWRCWMPREACRRYTEDGVNRGGYKRYSEVAGGKCQWGNVLKEICVALIMFYPSKALEKEWEKAEKDEVGWGEVAKRHGLSGESGIGVVCKGMMWLGGKVNVKGVEMNKGTEMVMYYG